MRKRRWQIPRYFLYVNAVLILGTVVTVGFISGAVKQLHTMLPEQVRLRGYQPPLTTEIYSTERHPDGTVTHTLLARVYKENREYTPLRQIPISLVHAMVAVEDRRFYTHRGISPRDIMRAAWVDVVGRRMRQGASTITQQLARNIWLTHERTWDRKLKEILLALELERNFAKDEILEMYLNEVYFGRGAYGVKTAAWTYFRKAPQDMALAECALLAGLPQRPSGNDPLAHPEIAKRRRAEVLRAMVREGHITAKQAAEAEKAQLVAENAGRIPAGINIARAPYFSDLVIRLLKQQYGVDVLYGGGLRVYTSLDLRLQEAAEKHLTEGVKSGVEFLRRSGYIKKGLIGQGALACVDVHDGRVLVLVGGVGPWKELQYNRAHPGPPDYGRQPGSSFKPYIWCAALESGYAPNSVFSANPISIRIGPGEPWRPKNYSPSHGGNYTLREALGRSVNLVSVRLVRALGIQRVRMYASQILNLPIDRLDAVYSIALGVSNLSPLEQASGFATFASGGLRYDRTFILRVEDCWGREIYRAPLKPVRVMRPAVALSMISMLGSVVTSGYGTGSRARAVGYACGGKTGTTQQGRDAWWVGFTPDLCAAVWVGNDDDSPMYRAAGGRFCAPIWAKFMKEAMQILEYDGKFPAGSGVVATKPSQPEKEEEEKEPQVILMCVSGMRATQYCNNTYEKTFAGDESLPKFCTVHGSPVEPAEPPELVEPVEPTEPGEPVPEPEPEVEPEPPAEQVATVTVCTESGKLAGPFCPSTEERTYPAGSAPRGKCPLHTAPPEVE